MIHPIRATKLSTVLLVGMMGIGWSFASVVFATDKTIGSLNSSTADASDADTPINFFTHARSLRFTT